MNQYTGDVIPIMYQSVLILRSPRWQKGTGAMADQVSKFPIKHHGNAVSVLLNIPNVICIIRKPAIFIIAASIGAFYAGAGIAYFHATFFTFINPVTGIAAFTAWVGAVGKVLHGLVL